MTINENDRLDLRQELERIFSDKRLADIAMEAMPPIDYDQLATKRDLDALGAGLRGEMSEMRGDLKSDIANNLRLMLAAQVTTMMMLGAWVAAVT